jgi:hypothetical protein
MAQSFLLLLALLVAAYLAIFFYRRVDEIGRNLTVAERYLAGLVGQATNNDERHRRAEDRRNSLGGFPVIAISGLGGPTLYDYAEAANESDRQRQTIASDKAFRIASILSELYDGRIGTAQGLIETYIRRGEESRASIAPGIDQLVGLRRLSATNAFPPGAGVSEALLRSAVRSGRHPRDPGLIARALGR